MRYIFLVLVLLPASAWGDGITVGPNGIDVPAGLDGTGVLIGEADVSRSGKAIYDDAARAAPNTTPAGVYHQLNPGMDPSYPNAGNNLFDEHGTLVASVMIDTSALARGVAPMAQLHSIGLGDGTTDPEDALVLNRLAANIGGGAISAINMSIGKPISEFSILERNGKSQLTQFVDWSARQHDVLYVVSWINAIDSPDEFYKPQDNFTALLWLQPSQTTISSITEFLSTT